MFLGIINILLLPESMQCLLGRYNELPEHAQRMVQVLLKKRVGNTRWLSSRPQAMEALNVKQTKLIELEKAGELDVIVDGGQVKILTDSIYDRLIRNVFDTYLGSDGRKAARVAPAHVTKHKRKVPPRTKAQRRGLADGNARRKEEARQRREKEAEGLSQPARK
jgi:hypothetical protein